MKPRVSARLPHRLHARLAGAAGRSAATQSAIVVEALESFFAERPDAGRSAALERRLDRMCRQLDRLERAGLLREETLALLAQVYLTLTPALSAEARAEARARGAERWADFEARLARRIAASRRTLGGVQQPIAEAGVDHIAVEPIDGACPKTVERIVPEAAAGGAPDTLAGEPEAEP
jgi:predicted DNA-binding protein